MKIKDMAFGKRGTKGYIFLEFYSIIYVYVWINERVKFMKKGGKKC